MLLENVPEFPIEILKALVSDMYEIIPFYIEPSDAGCEYLSRMRVFILMYLRGQLLLLHEKSQVTLWDS